MEMEVVRPSKNKFVTYGTMFYCHLDKREGEVLIRTYDGLVSLTNPCNVWSADSDVIEEWIEQGELVFLEKGTKVILTQE